MLFRSVILVVLVGLLSLAWVASADRPAVLSEKGAPPAVTSVSNPAKLALAEHLSSIGARMYSAYWAPIATSRRSSLVKTLPPSWM